MGLHYLLENQLGHWPKFQADTGWFSNLACLGMKLGHWPKFQNLQDTPYTTPEYHISTRFALQLAISKILAILHVLIDHNIKFQSFFKKNKCEIPISNFCEDCQETFRKSLVQKEQ